MIDTATTDHEVIRPGAWLRFKARVPFRLRRLTTQLERSVFRKRGVFVWIDNRRVRCAIDAAPVFVKQPDHEEERLLMRRVLDALRPGDTFLDVGSHVGLYAIGGALKVGTVGRVLAFEPTPSTVAKMRRNLALNELDRRVTVYEVALSATRGEVAFVTTGTSMMNSIFSGQPNGMRRVGGPERRIRVATAPIDEFVDPARRHVAKIDTEGHEWAVLSGANRLLASDARIFVELHPWAWESVDKTWDDLRQLAQRHGRTLRTLNGSLVDRPAHCRIEMAREPVAG